MINATKLKMYNSSLGHLAPPSLRGKSRSLNLDVLVEWALKVLELLKTGSASSAYDAKMAKKYLGWVCWFEEQIKHYSNMLDVVSLARHLVRQNGIHRHIADDFAIELENASLYSSVGWDFAVCELANEIYEFLDEQGNKVSIGKRSVSEAFHPGEGSQTRSNFRCEEHGF